MADKRFPDNPADTNPDVLDIIPGTDVSSDVDKKYTFQTVANTVKAIIGNATNLVSGMMSETDKVKLDYYPAGNPGNNKVLTTDASGDQVWVDKTTGVGDGGDMTKIVYDTNDDGVVDRADTADAITGTPGNDKVYTTDNAGNQVFVDQSTFLVGLGALPSGIMMPFCGSTAPAGYVFAAGKTIGDNGSGATERANLDTQALFIHLYDNFSDSELPVSGGRVGPNAIDDFVAGKTIATPDMRGRVAVGIDDMSGTSSAGRMNNLSSTTLGATGGSQEHQLQVNELASHSHTHGLTLPDHTHDLQTDVAAAGDVENIRDTSGAAATNTGTGGVNGALPAIGGTIDGAGGDAAHNNIQPVFFSTYVLKL